jgi:hypothetical protein
MEMTNVNTAISEIEKLHQQDIEATVSLNVDLLVDLWSEDCALLAQGDKPLVARLPFVRR